MHAPAARYAALFVVLTGGALSALAGAGSESGSPPPAAARPPAEILDRRPAAGEQCVVCRLRVHDGDIVEVRYKGRTLFVAAKMLEEFESDPETYFHLLEAHGGLFDEAAVEVPPMKTGWLLFGFYVLAGLVAGAACAYVALDRGLPAWRWFFAGLLGNVLALAAVLTRSRAAGAPDVGAARGLAKIPATHAPVTCDHCGAGNHPSAAACGGCGAALRPTIEPETARA